jgi:hypothetical protein
MVRFVINRDAIGVTFFRSIIMSNYNNGKKSIAITVDSVVPGERKLVLKRLKPPPPHLHMWVIDFLLFLAVVSVTGAIGIKKTLLFTAGLFRKPELMRLVAPGQPPEPEHLYRRPPTFL